MLPLCRAASLFMSLPYVSAISTAVFPKPNKEIYEEML